jgi:hypothetical protein
MERKIAAIHRKSTNTSRPLPITGSAHKTRVIGDPRHATVVASLDVTAGATGHDRAHHAPLDATQMPGMGQTIGVAMPA